MELLLNQETFQSENFFSFSLSPNIYFYISPGKEKLKKYKEDEDVASIRLLNVKQSVGVLQEKHFWGKPLFDNFPQHKFGLFGLKYQMNPLIFLDFPSLLWFGLVMGMVVGKMLNGFGTATLIFILWYLYVLYFMTNIKVTNMKKKNYRQRPFGPA